MLKRLQDIKKNTDQKQPQEEKNLSPNLLDLSLYQTTPLEEIKTKSRNSALPVIALTIAGIQLTLVFFVVQHHSLNTKIRDIKENSNKLAMEIQEKKYLVQQAEEIIGKINIYKKKRSHNNLMAPHIRFAITQLPKEINLKSINFKEKTAILNAETKTPLQLALLISKYFEGDTVDTVIIRTANLVPRKNSFAITLEVNFK